MKDKYTADEWNILEASLIGEKKNYEKKIDPVVESVIDKFRSRSEVGINKYGTTLEENKLSTLEWLNHLQEELMDASLYVEKLKNQIK